MKLNNRNLIAESLKSYEEVESPSALTIPAGYIKIRLSTKGKVGAPEVLHVRNFKVGELLTLSLSSNEELPRRLISILNDMILEDVDVANFHDKEVEELMVYIYSSFYKNLLEDVVFPIEDSDIEELEKTERGRDQLESIKSKKWIPRTTINIVSDVDPYEIPDDFNPNVTITNKETGFHVTFSYIKYGDKITVKNWLDSYFREEELKYKNIQNQISHNNSSPDKIDLNPEEEKNYYNYLSRKFETLSDVSKIISVIDYNGMDVSEMPLGEKYELLSKDARIDYGMIAKLTARQNKMPFGIKPLVRMINPFTKKICERRFSFRISVILQAIQLSGLDKYDDGYDDAN